MAATRDDTRQRAPVPLHTRVTLATLTNSINAVTNRLNIRENGAKSGQKRIKVKRNPLREGEHELQFLIARFPSHCHRLSRVRTSDEHLQGKTVVNAHGNNRKNGEKRWKTSKNKEGTGRREGTRGYRELTAQSYSMLTIVTGPKSPCISKGIDFLYFIIYI